MGYKPSKKGEIITYNRRTLAPFHRGVAHVELRSQGPTPLFVNISLRQTRAFEKMSDY